MPESDQALQLQLAMLKRLYHQGRLSEADYRQELIDLGLDPDAVPAHGEAGQPGQVAESEISPSAPAGTTYNLNIQHAEGLAIGDGARVEPPGAGASPQVLPRAYLHRLAGQTRRLPLAGVDPKAVGDEKSGELQLSAVYTALLTQRPDLEEATFPPHGVPLGKAWSFREGTPREGLGRETRRLSALEVLNREPRFVLLGDPGSGKSTFVNFIALCLAGEALGFDDANLAVLTAPLPVEDERQQEDKPTPQPWDHGALLPVRIVLRDLAARGLPQPGEPVDGDTLWRFIVDELGEVLAEYAPHLKRELMERGGLIMLDGLDEVPDADRRREQVKAMVQDFAGCFPRCRFLVTSRTYAYQRQDWKLEGFAEAVLSPFTPAQINRFIDSWYTQVAALRGLDPGDAQGRAALLKTAIARSERLAELATRPLLLTLMASLHAWRGGSLPEKREELYADAVDLLLDQWESPKVVRDAAGQPLVRQPSLAEWLKVDRAVVRAELNRLAFQAHRDQPGLVDTADVSQERLVSALLDLADNRDLKPARLVEYIRDRAGLLAARGEGVYTFPHRTFQEYLAACHLTDHGYPDELADLARADPGRWREVTLLAGAKAARGTSSAAWNLAEALCFRDPPGPGQEVAEADPWGALLAAQTLLENEGARLGQVSERNAPKLERVRRWLLAVVTRGLLPPVDRALAGNALAALGDDRDFDELVVVPAGPFLMGSSDADGLAQDWEKPLHQVTLAAFRIGKYPVTNAQYLRFVGATGREWESEDGRRPERANHPAVTVSWHDARAYCEWLTDVWRAAGKLARNEVVRLPSEAEWEKAARGGLPSPSEGERLGPVLPAPARAYRQGRYGAAQVSKAEGERVESRIYPWGDAWDETRCNTSELGLGETCTVGIFPKGASPYDCLDMAGNVWEWTISLWGKDLFNPQFRYPYNPTDGREDLEAGDKILRVVRGGSWLNVRSGARCAFRSRNSPSGGWYLRGFRIVVSPISPASAL